MSNFIITLQEAEDIVENFQSISPKEKPIIQYGGIIDVSSLPFIQNPSLIYNGLMAWFGLNKQGELVLFFEDDVSYDPKDLPKKPVKENLIESDRIIRNTFLGETVKRRIQDLRVPPKVLSKKDKSISNGDVISAINRFKREFPIDEHGALNKYPFGFFENETILDFSIFIGQPEIKYIAYFFGFNDSKPEYIATNRIRIVLAGLSEQGIPITKNRESALDDGILLQYSWPPNPTT